MNLGELEQLGEPDLVIARLRVWVHGRQFPQAADYWDGNWLLVTAYWVSPDSMVRAHGPILHLGELAGLLRECEALYKTLRGGAALRCIEPNLAVELKAENGGRISAKLSITPDHMNESHRFEEEIDQTYLPPVIGSCQAILEKYPIREPEALANWQEPGAASDEA
jgi:hypothetical protein